MTNRKEQPLSKQNVVVVKEDTVRSWIKKALNEFGTVPQSTQPPVQPIRTDVTDAGEGAVLTLPPYRGSLEKRPPPKSMKSTRTEKGLDPAELQDISANLRAPVSDIGGKTWTRDDLYIPEHRGLGVSGVRKELETASDKIQLAQATPELVLQMFEQAVKDYKHLLEDPMRVVKAGLKEYTRDIEGSGELSKDEIIELRSVAGQAALASSRGFSEFFNEWVANEAPEAMRRIHKKSEPIWFGSIFTVARTGTLDLNDPTPSRGSLREDFLMETSYQPSTTVVDRALILRDPGFRYFVGGLGGKHVYYWDAVRNAAEKVGKYKGQL